MQIMERINPLEDEKKPEKENTTVDPGWLHVHCPICGTLVVTGIGGSPKCVDHLFQEIAQEEALQGKLTSARVSL